MRVAPAGLTMASQNATWEDGTMDTYRIKVAGGIAIGKQYTIAGVVVPQGSTVHFNHGTTLVLRTKGHSENPGSRYSGLFTYYPAMFKVYEIQTQSIDENGDTRIVATPVTEFPVRTTKEV